MSTVAIADAYRKVVVTTGTGSGGVPGTTVSQEVGGELNLDAGFGISLVADVANNKVTIVNTGNGTGALTTITDNNNSGTYYPIFTRSPPGTQTFTVGGSDFTSGDIVSGVAEVRITGSSNSVSGVSATLRAALVGMIQDETFSLVRVSNGATLNFTATGPATYSTINGYWTIPVTAAPIVTDTFVSITIATGAGELNPITGTYQMDTMYLDQTTTPLTYNPNTGLMTVNNLSVASHVTLEGVTSTGATGTGKLVFDTAPVIAGGSVTGLTTFGIRDTTAAYDVRVVATSTSATLTANRTLTLDIGDAARTVQLNGNLSLGGTFTTNNNFTIAGPYEATITPAGVFNATFPAGTYTLPANNQTFYIGTTALTIDRTSAAQALTGITSIDGNAATVTNGVYTTGSYSDPSWLTISATKVGLGNVTNESKATMFTDPTFTGTVSGVSATMVGLGNVTNESKATMFTSPTFTGHPTIEGVTSTGATGTGNLVFSASPTFTGTVSGIDATMVGLGNVTNESKATMFTSPTFTGHPTIEGVTSTGATGTGDLVFSASPTFTGTVSGVSATMVGLGNVTNESKATMFTSPTFTGVVTLPGVTETVSAPSYSATIAIDISAASVFYITPSNSYALNFTNMPSMTNKMLTITLIIVQGGTAYMPGGYQLNGVTLSPAITWVGGSQPSGTASKSDIINISFYYNAGGTLTKVYGGVSTYG